MSTASLITAGEGRRGVLQAFPSGVRGGKIVIAGYLVPFGKSGWVG